MIEPLSRSFYDRYVDDVARELLGMVLVRESRSARTTGRIVEVEAYRATDDPANHAFKGQTRRNASMFGPPGHAYVYSIHSRFCFNAVTEPEGIASAVLIRAVEPLEGLAFMQQRRGRERLLELTRGPGRLSEAFEIDREFDGNDLTESTDVWIGRDRPLAADEHIGQSPRIGVTSAHDLTLRFFLDGNRFVSGPRNVHRRPLR